MRVPTDELEGPRHIVIVAVAPNGGDAVGEHTVSCRTSSDKHLCPGLSECARDASADAVGASSDEGDATVETMHARMFGGRARDCQPSQ